jgi:serine/threonine protein phosphatase PrpC
VPNECRGRASRDVDAMNARLPALSSDAVHADQTCREATFASRFVRLDTAVASSRGVGHTVNEDCHSALHGRSPVFVVADGVGGGALASRASEELVSRLHATLGRGRIAADTIHAAILEADRGIEASIASRTSAPGAATLALCAATDRLLSRWIVGWVGDCRVYRVGSRGGDPARLLTRDDSYRHLHERPPSGVSTDDPARMVGNGATTGANALVLGVERGELLALCSDGVHKHLDDADWCRVLAAPLPLARRADTLVALARAHGSVDDATVLLLQRSEQGWRVRRSESAATGAGHDGSAR